MSYDRLEANNLPIMKHRIAANYNAAAVGELKGIADVFVNPNTSKTLVDVDAYLESYEAALKRTERYYKTAEKALRECRQLMGDQRSGATNARSNPDVRSTFG